MKKYQSFLSKNFQFLEVTFSIYLNRHVFVMDMLCSVKTFVLQCFMHSPQNSVCLIVLLIYKGWFGHSMFTYEISDVLPCFGL